VQPVQEQEPVRVALQFQGWQALPANQVRQVLQGVIGAMAHLVPVGWRNFGSAHWWLFLRLKRSADVLRQPRLQQCLALELVYRHLLWPEGRLK
jgi:hypothetical protein